MKVLALALGLALLAGEAQAISRYQTVRMSCDEVQAALQDEGAAILRWQSKRGAGLPIYERYVANSRFCNSNEIAVPARVPTADELSCPVRKCEIQEFEDFGRSRIIVPGG